MTIPKPTVVSSAPGELTVTWTLPSTFYTSVVTGPSPAPPMPSRPHPLAGKTSIAIGVMLALLAVPYVSPALARFRIARAPWDHTAAADLVALPCDGPAR